MRTDGSSNATWNPSIFGGFLWAALTVVTVLPLAPAGAQEAAPFFISQLDPKKAAPGEVVVLRFKSPLPSPVSTVTFDDLKADILGSSDYAVRVSVPSGLVANSTPVVVVRTGSRASEPYQDFTVAGLPAPAASPTSAPAAKKTEWESWLVPIIIIIGGMAVLVGYSYTFWQRTRELRRQSAERAKALESFRTQLQAARTPPSTTPTEGPPAVPDSLVSACAAGECVLLAGSELEPALGTSTTVELFTQLVEAAQNRVPLELWQSLPTALVQGEIERLKELLQGTLGPAEVRAAIAARTDASPGRPNDIAKTLGLIAFSGLITLSWDRTLDGVFSARLQATSKEPETAGRTPVPGLKRGAQFFLLRPFGDPLAESPFSFTLRAFRSMREDNPELGRVLASAFTRNTVLFLGCQVEEIEQFIAAANIRANTDRLHYALVPRSNVFSLQKSSIRNAYQIELIGYDPSDLEAIAAFVKQLGDKLSSRDALTPALPKNRLSLTKREAPKIDEVRLVNIGPFIDNTIPFDKPWTVILANNGSGKSTVLKALALALAGEDNRIIERSWNLLREGAATGSVEVRSGKERYRAELVRDASQNRVIVRAAQDSPIQSGRWVVFGFPAVRGVSVQTQGRAGGFSEPLVDDVLPLVGSGPDPRLNDLKNLIIDAHTKSEDSAVPNGERETARRLRDALFSTLDRLTPGFQIAFSRVDYNATPKEVYVHTSDGELPMSVLSQGISSTFGWAGTVLARLFDIYKGSPNPAREPALLLVDEIDSHLHPKWQQLLAPAVKDLFPNLVVIATSHSPLMVGTLEKGELVRIRRTGDGLAAERVQEDYRGYRADQILTDAAFELETARDPAVEHQAAPLREEYARLLRKEQRNPKEQERLGELIRRLEHRLAPPGETPPERAAAQSQRAAEQLMLSDSDFDPEKVLASLANERRDGVLPR
jgi:predicted ATP-binding protein involved in virulence